jgi:uroporphyrinogen decarboxylase
MLSRRDFLAAAVATSAIPPARLTSKQRIDRALKGQDVDRPPFTFWYHFGLQEQPASHHAKATLEFHRKFHTDLVKVMSDFPYPKPAGKWYELKVVSDPFPEQVRALEIIRDGLQGTAYFVETVFNPWNVAEKLSSPEEVKRLMAEKPQALLDALEAITRSEIEHVKKAVATGVSGIFLAVANAGNGILSQEEYAKFSEPFDKMILAAVSNAPLNTLHLHGDKVYLDRFYRDWPASVLNYSTHGTGVSITEVRGQYAGVIMGGLDEVNFRKLASAELKTQWQAAGKASGKRFLLAPGCSVPNETADEELLRLATVLGA